MNDSKRFVKIPSRNGIGFLFSVLLPYRVVRTPRNNVSHPFVKSRSSIPTGRRNRESRPTPMELQLQTQATRYPVKPHASGFRFELLCEFARIFLFYRAFSPVGERVAAEKIRQKVARRKNNTPVVEEASDDTMHRNSQLAWNFSFLQVARLR